MRISELRKRRAMILPRWHCGGQRVAAQEEGRAAEVRQAVADARQRRERGSADQMQALVPQLAD